MPLLRDVLAAMDDWYPPSSAESWDRVGLSCGDPGEDIGKVLLALDCLPATVDQALATGCQLLITHHPLLLTAVHTVAADSAKGAMVHRMIRGGLAHFAAHTNADIADFGVSAALADAVGLHDVRPLVATSGEAMDHLAVFVPRTHLDAVRSAIGEAGAGGVGDYAECTFTVDGIGTFRPLPGAQPFEGTVGELSEVAEVRLSTVLPRGRRAAVLAALREAHPYEEVAYELTERPALPASVGSGRIGVLEQPITLAEFVRQVASTLPRTEVGIRAAGDAEQLITIVAVCGGSGASFTEQARAAGADAFLTADLKHHSTLEAVDERDGLSGRRPMALIDATHYATEAVWLPILARRLADRFGSALTVEVSELVTDPWRIHAH